MNTGISRRRFLHSAGALLGGALAHPAAGVGSSSVAAAPPNPELARLRGLFRDPPLSARPMTRWWWFGGAVTPEEVSRELTFMRDAGLGGAEIQPVYPVAVDDPARGVRHLRYFTGEWFEALRHAVREARRLGLALDLTLGSGWPYGGPFVPVDLAARRLRVMSQDVVGPRSFTWDIAPLLTGEDRIVAVVAAPVLASQQPDLARAQVLADQPRAEGEGAARSGPAIRDWPVPAGEWRLHVYVDSPTGQQVKRTTLGMEGLVLDHFSAEALATFLVAAGDRVLDAVGGAAGAPPPFRSVFCDSLEVYGADWTKDLRAEFRARRGYDLAPFLPALWQEAGPETPHVRHDYHLTLSELLLERFFRPLRAWSERRGLTARIQAHGAMGDVMRGYGLAHVPEGESIFGGDRYAVNLRHRRLASSAAHVHGQRLVSAETYTWLRTPLFTTTLEMMKAATDAMFLDGVNHVVNHGYSYSPPQAGEPGWSFYASTEINHTNTWWRHYPHLARYVRRVQALLQEGAAVNPVGIYLPLADVYAAHGAGGLHLDVELERRLGSELPWALRTAGYDFDLLNDHALTALARVEGGRLLAGSAAYSVVVVPPVAFMPHESAARLAELARQGGHLVFVGRLPDAAPGRAEQPARTAELRRALWGLWAGREPELGEIVGAGRGSAVLVAGVAAALAQVGRVLPSDFHIVDAGRGGAEARAAAARDVGFLHRRSDGVDYYFVANVSAQPRELRVRFAAGHRAPERWDTETGERRSIACAYVREGAAELVELDLPLEPFESCFVVFGGSRAAPTGGRGDLRRAAAARLPEALELRGQWRLRLGEGPPIALERLVSWTELADGRSFSGWGGYETAFDLPDLGTDVDWAIDLGTVHETAEVTLNGRALGAAWKRPRRLACGTALRAGRNELVVEVANLWIHHVAAQPPPAVWKDVAETFGIRWGRYGELKLDALPPAGLLGPVRIVPLARVRAAR